MRSLHHRSLLRVYALLAMVMVVLLPSSLYLPWPEIEFVDSFRTLTALYIALCAVAAGLFGLVLSLRGEPVLPLAMNLLLAPAFVIFFISDDHHVLAIVGFVLHIGVVSYLSYDCYQRA